jgi:2-polyprenyl-6-methoxyphenol hydroxylase-like FAD-dependent oxidoreductase
LVEDQCGLLVSGELSASIGVVPSNRPYPKRSITRLPFAPDLGLMPATRAVNQPSFIRRMPGRQACLIGDAWSHKDSVTAQGITDALLDADLLNNIVTARSAMDDSFEAVLSSEWQRRTADYREEVERAYELASFMTPTPQFTNSPR